MTAITSPLIQNNARNLRKFSEFSPMIKSVSGNHIKDVGNNVSVSTLLTMRVQEGRGAGDAIRG
jgi:hypothetical protein